MRGGDETFETVPAHEDTAAIVAGNHYLNKVFGFQQTACLLPVVLLQTHVDRDNQVIILIAGIEDVDRHFRANLQPGAHFRVEPLEVLHGHDAVALRPHIDDHFTRVDLQDYRVANFTPLRR